MLDFFRQCIAFTVLCPCSCSTSDTTTSTKFPFKHTFGCPYFSKVSHTWYFQGQTLFSYFRKETNCWKWTITETVYFTEAKPKLAVRSLKSQFELQQQLKVAYLILITSTFLFRKPRGVPVCNQNVQPSWFSQPLFSSPNPFHSGYA